MKPALLGLIALCCRTMAYAPCPNGCDCDVYDNTLLCHTTADTVPLVAATNMSGTYLYVTYSECLTRIDGDRLTSPNLTYVYLDNNGIASIEDDAFKHVGRARVLSIAHNRLTTVSPKLFAPLEQLMYLDLSHNPIHRLADDTFNGLKTLALLDVSHTALASLRFIVSMTDANRENAYLLRVNASSNQQLRLIDDETAIASTRIAALILYNNTNLVCRCERTKVQHACDIKEPSHRHRWTAFVQSCYGSKPVRSPDPGGDSLSARTRRLYEMGEVTTVPTSRADGASSHDNAKPVPIAKREEEENYLVRLFRTNSLLVQLALMWIALLLAVLIVIYSRFQSGGRPGMTAASTTVPATSHGACERCKPRPANVYCRCAESVDSGGGAPQRITNSRQTPVVSEYLKMKSLPNDCGTYYPELRFAAFEDYERPRYDRPPIPRLVSVTEGPPAPEYENCKTDRVNLTTTLPRLSVLKESDYVEIDSLAHMYEELP